MIVSDAPGTVATIVLPTGAATQFVPRPDSDGVVTPSTVNTNGACEMKV